MKDPTRPHAPAEATPSPSAADLGEPADPEGARVGGRRNGKLLVAVAATAVLFIGAGAAAALTGDSRDEGEAEPKPSRLAAAREACSPGDSLYAQLGDDGRTLTLQGAGEETRGLEYNILKCYWRALDVPDAIVAEIGATRALDGRQNGEWDTMRASWSYHPDNGLQMVFTTSE
ncbi:hypothetical protein AB0873_26665 [Micromonospora sp. NPDC047707]|uniref:hypothetical protein n=1 Tax=Micromonospora sp. NPDC047707 TaxID=3154498 RepID=UPI0034544950